MVGGEAVPNPPQHCLGAARDIDLAVDGSDVGLHRVRAETGQRCHLGVAVALGDQRQYLGFPVGKSLASSRPVQSIDAAGPKARNSAFLDAFQDLLLLTETYFD